MRTAVYIVETDNSKKPEEASLGKRRVNLKTRHIDMKSVQIMNDRTYDGHINRNIRLALATIDLARPYIKIVDY